jgi:hypothetical protein
VAFVGGAILFARFRGAGIPDAALGKIPQSELLTVGADQLVAPFVASAGIALAFWLLWFKAPIVSDIPGRRWRGRLLLLGVGIALGYHLITVSPDLFDPNNPDQLLAFGLALVVAGVGARGAFLLGESAVARKRDRGAVVTAFVAVVLVTSMTLVAVATYALYLAEPEMQAVALRLAPHAPGVGRSGAHVLSGAYIGESSNSIYIGEVRPSRAHPGTGVKNAGYILEIPRANVLEMHVGYFRAFNRALVQGSCMARWLQGGAIPHACARIAVFPGHA